MAFVDVSFLQELWKKVFYYRECNRNVCCVQVIPHCGWLKSNQVDFQELFSRDGTMQIVAA